MKSLALTLGVIAAGALAQAGPVVYIPATSKIWLAGMPDGTQAGAGDAAPAQSPVLVTGLNFASGGNLNFNVWGVAAHGPDKLLWGANGTTLSSHNFGAQFGMSDLGAPLSSLVGVFLTGAQPDLALPPPTLTWADQSFGDYLTLTPLLQQTFFIGDGWTNVTQQPQWIAIPAGATRLYLGTLDGQSWNDNVGGYNAHIVQNPEPSTFALLGTALLAVGLLRRRSRRGL